MTDMPELAPAAKRDLLGRACYIAHLVVVVVLGFGWVVPLVDFLYVYLVLVPLVAVQWMFNAGSCVMNNVESWLRTGRWRDPGNAEEGAFLLALVKRFTGFDPGRAFMDAATYALMALLWLLALGHLWLAGEV